MPPAVDENQIRRIAHLARLHLRPDEVALFAPQLAEILAYVEQLGQVDTSGVEPLAHPLPLVNVLRPDEPTPPLDPERVLQNAPAVAQRYFKVPPVLDPGGGA
ncbi:MAG: Asp-tRNA(Asn)/Glu-tRNA(Gln) amidotransferase subunit GatC [Phycisphaerales bacterium]|nr:Asp-tRNA(Asn)/Glu-tRNA(Gln) amidotransferase subunit GatC [Phycisphaerales bacterium]